MKSVPDPSEQLPFESPGPVNDEKVLQSDKSETQMFRCEHNRPLKIIVRSGVMLGRFSAVWSDFLEALVVGRRRRPAP